MGGESCLVGSNPTLSAHALLTLGAPLARFRRSGWVGMGQVQPDEPAQRARIGSAAIALAAQRQGGIVSREQLIDAGLSGSAISRWKAAGRLHRVLPRVYAVGHTALGIEGRLHAALLHVGPGAALSHTTAAWWWALIDSRPRRIHDSTTTKRGFSSSAICVHRPKVLEPAVHRQLPVTPVARTLVDLAAMLPDAQLRRALAEAHSAFSPSASLPACPRPRSTRRSPASRSTPCGASGA